MALDYNLVTDIRHREGFEKGFEKGFNDGFSKGYKKHTRLVVKNLLSQTELKPEQIATVAGVALEVVEKLKGDLKKQKGAKVKK
ncbi:MAG: hypothetical protein KDD27_22060 [Saprospiraceae bacterium]|nr:hypothetical protein [Saprospiraceae bacterium]